MYIYINISGTSRCHISNVDKKMKECIPILMVPLDSSDFIFIFNNFDKKMFPNSSLPVAVSPKWLIVRKDEMDWGADEPCEFSSSVPETHLKVEVRKDTRSFHGIWKCIGKARSVDVMDSVLRYV